MYFKAHPPSLVLSDDERMDDQARMGGCVGLRQGNGLCDEMRLTDRKESVRGIGSQSHLFYGLLWRMEWWRG